MLAIEVVRDEPLANSTFGRASSNLLQSSWPVRLLWFLADGYVHERWGLLPRVEHFGMLSTLCTPQPELGHLVTPEGYLGFLVGAPLGDDALPNGGRIIALQLITPDEYAFVASVDDGGRAKRLSAMLCARGLAHHSSSTRDSLV